MAIQVTIENITGQTPYDIYICQTGGTGCFYMTTISSVPYSFDIPSPYDTSLAYMVKIIDNNGCVISGQSSVLSVCPSPTPTPSNTATPTVTPTITPSSVTPTPTPTNTKTPTPTKTATPTITPTKTATPTPTPTNTPTVTPTKTQTPTVTPTQTKTPTVTPTNTVTPTVTPTNTKTPTPTPTPTSTSAAIVCTSCVQLSGGTINGITVGVSYSGDVATYTFGPTTGCTSVFTPADSILVGQFSNFSLTFSFSQPEMATAVRVRKVAEIERVIELGSPKAVHYVASANPGCLSFLSGSGINIEMVHPVTLLAQSLASQYSKGDNQ